LGREFLDSKGISENANILCHVMQPNALLIWQNFIIAKSGRYRSEPGQCIGGLVISSKDVVELKTVKLLVVSTDVEPLYSELGGDVQAIHQGFVLGHIIGSMEVRPNDVKELVSFWRDQHYTSPGTIEGEGAIEIHAPMLLGVQGMRLLGLSPLGQKICQGLGLDCRLGHIRYVEPHKLERPLGDPSYGESILDDFSETKRGYHPDGRLSK
jgi:hypothetical protein